MDEGLASPPTPLHRCTAARWGKEEKNKVMPLPPLFPYPLRFSLGGGGGEGLDGGSRGVNFVPKGGKYSRFLKIRPSPPLLRLFLLRGGVVPNGHSKYHTLPPPPPLFFLSFFFLARGNDPLIRAKLSAIYIFSPRLKTRIKIPPSERDVSRTPLIFHTFFA